MKTNVHFFIICRSLLLRMRNVLDNSCRENQNIHFMFSNFCFKFMPFFFEVILKNIVERAGPHMTVWRMCIECWIPKATSTNSDYVPHIAVPLQQWLNERATMLR
jgi:hypothetical protein